VEPVRWRKPRATRESRKSRAERGWRPRRPVRVSEFSEPLANSVKRRISTALRRTLEAQKARPVWRMWSGVGAELGALVMLDKSFEFNRHNAPDANGGLIQAD
jgi:hypothetical protein